ncbi:MAG: LPS assembly lipoprotein LptE [Helicobacteraceae bacterium]|jgi:basic membrane lipoprotein Med (substrate-binding protein (PBP1-ABC) superfamily)|nr:LPS assembly lipoprotein LptE [Helicobacteraceae bacterium]
MRAAAFALCAIWLLGCGYKPIEHYTKEALGDKIFVDVIIPLSDPQSAPVLIDTVREAIVVKFGRSLVSREQANTVITVKSGVYSLDSLQKDRDGFTTMYRSGVQMSVIVRNEKLRDETFEIHGVHDFGVEPSAVLSESIRQNAVKEATLKALDALISKLVMLGR